MLISISATKEQAVDEYVWMEFDGARGKEVSQRTHKRKINKGVQYGIKSLRNGSRFTLIFPDLIHINFPLDKATGEYLIERSTKLKTIPEFQDRASRKTAGVKSVRRQELRRDFSNPRFTPKGVLAEPANGINFENYQWRIVPEQMRVLHSKGREVLLKGELIGMRFERASRGGVAVTREGMMLRLDTDAYDTLVNETDLLPIQEWPNGYVDPETMKEYKRNRTKAAKNAIQNTDEALRLQRKADALEQELRRKQDSAERRETARAEQRKYDEIRAKIKSGEMQAPERELIATLPEHITKDRTLMRERTLRQIEDDNDELVEEIIDFNARDPELVLTTDEDSTESPSEYDLENILHVRPVAAPVFAVEETFANIFNPKTEEQDEEEADNPFSLEGLSDGEDDDDEDSDGDTDSSSDADSDSDGEDGESEDDESDDSDSDDDDDPAEDDDGDGDPDDEDDSEDVSDGDDDADGTENEEDPDSGSKGDEEQGEGSSGGSDSGDDEESDGTSAKDQKVDGMSDEEAAKVAKKYAAANSNLASSSRDPEEGDVLVFNNDKKMKREFCILNVSTHKKSAKLVTYRLYDLTNAPDTVNVVTINKARGQSILDQATHIKDMRPGVFNRIYDMTENMKTNNEAIMS